MNSNNVGLCHVHHHAFILTARIFMMRVFQSCSRDVLGTAAPNFFGTFFQTELCLMIVNEHDGKQLKVLAAAFNRRSFFNSPTLFYTVTAPSSGNLYFKIFPKSHHPYFIPHHASPRSGPRGNTTGSGAQLLKNRQTTQCLIFKALNCGEKLQKPRILLFISIRGALLHKL